MKSVRRIIAVLSESLIVASLVACNGNKEPETTTAQLLELRAYKN